MNECRWAICFPCGITFTATHPCPADIYLYKRAYISEGNIYRLAVTPSTGGKKYIRIESLLNKREYKERPNARTIVFLFFATHFAPSLCCLFLPANSTKLLSFFFSSFLFIHFVHYFDKTLRRSISCSSQN